MTQPILSVAGEKHSYVVRTKSQPHSGVSEYALSNSIYYRYSLYFLRILIISLAFVVKIKSETNSEKQRKTERFAEKPKENIIYLKYTPEKS